MELVIVNVSKRKFSAFRQLFIVRWMPCMDPASFCSGYEQWRECVDEVQNFWPFESTSALFDLVKKSGSRYLPFRDLGSFSRFMCNVRKNCRNPCRKLFCKNQINRVQFNWLIFWILHIGKKIKITPRSMMIYVKGEEELQTYSRRFYKSVNTFSRDTLVLISRTFHSCVRRPKIKTSISFNINIVRQKYRRNEFNINMICALEIAKNYNSFQI